MSGLEQLIKSLVDMKVKFIVVGAYAAVMHGSSVRTQDLDICHERTLDNYKKIIGALAPFRPRLRGIPDDLKAPFDEHSLAQGTNVTLMTDLGHLDLLGEIDRCGRICTNRWWG